MKARVLAFVPVLLLVSSFGQARATSGSIAFDPSDTAAIARVVAPLGLTPADVIVQPGPFNYAGPSCPGAGWNCAPSGVPVVQTSNAGANAFECTGTSAGPNECTVVQISTGGNNVARCVLGSQASPVTANPVAQSCSITQSNTTGLNDALARQAVSQSMLTTLPIVESATQNVSIDQDNGAGANLALVDQWLKQKAETKSWNGSVSQSQEANVDASVTQDSGSGNQTLDVIQFVDQIEIAKFNVAGPITQRQNATDDGEEVNSFSRQFSDSGVNDTDLTQTLNLYGEGKSSHGNVVQTQGSPSGGLVGDLDGDSLAHGNGSRFDAIQRKTWKQVAATPGVKTQLQDDLELCCILGGAGKTYDLCTIDQSAVLDQSPGGTQDIDQRGRAFANENCTLRQYGETDDDTQLTERSGTAFDVSNECPNGGNCEVVDIAPQSHVTLGARNESDGETAYGPSAAADPGETIGYEVGYSNTGNGDAHVVLVSAAIPAGSSFLDCTASCTLDAGTVSWDLETVAAGAATSVTFRTTLTGPFDAGTTPVTTSATADTKEEAPVTSEVVVVQVTASPDSELHKAVRDVSRNQQFTGDQSPNDTGSFAGDTIEYRLTYHNHGNAVATGVFVNDPLPQQGASYIAGSCAPTCSLSGGTLTWDLGTVPVGGTVVMTFRMRMPTTLGATIPNTGNTSSATEPQENSNTVTVRVLCVAGQVCL